MEEGAQGLRDECGSFSSSSLSLFSLQKAFRMNLKGGTDPSFWNSQSTAKWKTGGGGEGEGMGRGRNREAEKTKCINSKNVEGIKKNQN